MFFQIFSRNTKEEKDAIIAIHFLKINAHFCPKYNNICVTCDSLQCKKKILFEDQWSKFYYFQVSHLINYYFNELIVFLPFLCVIVCEIYQQLLRENSFYTKAASQFRGCILLKAKCDTAERQRLSKFEGFFESGVQMRPLFPGQ